MEIVELTKKHSEKAPDVGKTTQTTGIGGVIND